MSAIEDLIGKEVLRKDGEKVKVETFCGPDKVVGLYFSAHWCPPCRGFTPQLATFYDAMKAKGKNLEIVFVSSDRDEASWKDYFDSMPWLALDFSDRELKEKLGAKHGVRGIPTFILFDGKTGEVIQREARGKERLSTKFDIQGIPTWVLLDGDTGVVLHPEADTALGDDPEGKNFPWKQ